MIPSTKIDRKFSQEAFSKVKNRKKHVDLAIVPDDCPVQNSTCQRRDVNVDHCKVPVGPSFVRISFTPYRSFVLPCMIEANFFPLQVGCRTDTWRQRAASFSPSTSWLINNCKMASLPTIVKALRTMQNANKCSTGLILLQQYEYCTNHRAPYATQTVRSSYLAKWARYDRHQQPSRGIEIGWNF